jgi:hypothetical protein
MIDARQIPTLRLELHRLRGAYKAQKELLKSLPAGKARGLAGQALSLIGKEGRLVAEHVKLIEEAAKQLGVIV